MHSDSQNIGKCGWCSRMFQEYGPAWYFAWDSFMVLAQDKKISVNQSDLCGKTFCDKVLEASLKSIVSICTECTKFRPLALWRMTEVTNEMNGVERSATKCLITATKNGNRMKSDEIVQSPSLRSPSQELLALKACAAAEMCKNCGKDPWHRDLETFTVLVTSCYI
jgi:hypothetical protein